GESAAGGGVGSCGWVIRYSGWLPCEWYSEATYQEGNSMKRALVSSLALFCFATIAAIVVQSSRASPSVRSATFNFDIPATFTEDKYVQMAEARPGNRKIG